MSEGPVGERPRHRWGDEFGPLMRGGRFRAGGPDWRRIGAITGTMLGVFVLIVAVTAGGVLWYGTSILGRVDVPNLDARGGGDDAVDIDEVEEVLNVLVVGSDSREGLTDEELQAMGTEPEAGLRTDTIMLVHLDPRRDRAAILSFPRDLLITRCDGSRGRINASYAIGERQRPGGGAACMVETVTEFTGINVHHFVQVDFRGFIDIVNALDGVTIYLEEPLVDRHAGVDLPAGCVELDGPAALGFVRARRVDSDFGRIARQQRFIHEVVSEASSVGTLVNLPRLFSLVDAAARAVEADRDLTLNQMRRIAFSLRSLEADAIDTRTVPATPRTINGTAFVVADAEDAQALFAAFRDGSVFPDDVGTADPQPVQTADVAPLVVLNGAGVAGLAAKGQAELEAAGFTVAETGNAERFDFQRTQVIYPPDALEEGELVRDALADAALVPGEQGEPITVVLGTDYEPRPVDELTPAPSDSPTPTPTPTTAPAPTFVGADPTPGRC